VNKRTLRKLLKWSVPLNIIVFTAAMLDFWLWTSRGMIVILSLYALLLVAILVLVIIDETPHFQRVAFEDPNPGPKTVVYGRP
jgi:hypothetical protein